LATAESPATISHWVSILGGANTSGQVNTDCGAAEIPISANDQTGIGAFEALRMPMNDG
jgi:hypothetical protein